MKTIVLLMVFGLVGCLTTEEFETFEEEQDDTEEVEQPVDYQESEPDPGAGCGLYANSPVPVLCQEVYLDKGRPPEKEMLPNMYLLEQQEMNVMSK